MKQDELAQLVDEFGRTADSVFELGAMLGFLEERTAKKVDEKEVFDLAASSIYLFESWAGLMSAKFIPRRRFFQGAEFRITPLKEEVEGGFLFPGHRFMPFICRDIFPADAWLLQADGSAPHVKRIDFPMPLAMNALCFFGREGALGYLASDEPGNAGQSEAVSVSVFDLRDFYLENHFKPGDSIMVKVLDWLQGVFSIAHAPAEDSLADTRDWTRAMRGAYERMQAELGAEGDCYEQFAIMMLLGAEDGRYPLMKQPPLSLAAFFNLQQDIVVKPLADRAVLCAADAEPEEKALLDFFDLDDDGVEPSMLDGYFKELGLSLSEGDAEAYMRDALFHGENNPDKVLDRVTAGRALFFKSADDQDMFHDLWLELWEDVELLYSETDDPFAETRSQLLSINDKCFAVVRELDKRGALGEVLKNPVFLRFGQLTASMSAMLVLLNCVGEVQTVSRKQLDEMMGAVVPALESLIEQLSKS